MRKTRITVAVATLVFSGSAQAAPLLGQRVDLTRGAASALRSTGICTDLTCENTVIARIDARTIYLGALDRGAFTYLVDGRVAMVGWMGRPLGELPLTPTPAQFNRLAQKVAGQSLPAAWTKATLQNWDQSVGLDPTRVTRVTRPSAIFGGKVGDTAWYTIYIAQPAHEARLRALINRREPRNARAVAERFLRDASGPLSTQRDQCPAGSKPLIATLLLDNKTQDGFREYFRRRAMPSIGCCGAPPTFALPGLSASSVSIETRNFQSQSVDQMPNACVESQ